ncbi:MAG: type I restriction enzyme HsdR N-terminal domain-containing protein [Bacteroidetes bacterium]|mgnify:CR=1 FL=1|nr:type I restriction enzyme HsdR N-terminal domain-containing protein [Bacteroidota bacterium]
MLSVQFPDHQFNLKKENNATFIFDEVRKKWLVLTPEEWVRQNFVQYLIKSKKYPSTCIALEKSFKLGEMKKRFDIVVYKNQVPWILVECKNEKIPLDESILKQVLIYHQKIKANILIITNGQQSFAVELKGDLSYQLQSLPEW